MGFFLPLVSAIITTHNRQDLAEKAIYSVLAQTYNNIELIVVDDASEFSSSEYLRNLADLKGFRYIYIPKKDSKGGNHARNVGINASSGEILAFLDDDDEWMPEKIEKQVRFLKNHPEYSVVSCLRLREIDFTKYIPETKSKIEGDVKELIFTCTPYMTSTIMIKKQLIDACGAFDEELKYWQDYEFGIRFSQYSKVGCLHEYLCLYRIVHNDKKKLSNNLDGWERAVEYIEEKHSGIIEKLPKDIKYKHKLLIARDGQNRALNVMRRKSLIKYSIQVVKLRPSIRNIMKLVLSFLGLKWQIKYV